LERNNHMDYSLLIVWLWLISLKFPTWHSFSTNISLRVSPTLLINTLVIYSFLYFCNRRKRSNVTWMYLTIIEHKHFVIKFQVSEKLGHPCFLVPKAISVRATKQAFSSPFPRHFQHFTGLGDFRTFVCSLTLLSFFVFKY
jgi:hypothetical protein